MQGSPLAASNSTTIGIDCADGAADSSNIKRVVVGHTQNATSLDPKALPPHGMCIFFMRGIDCTTRRMGCMGLHLPKIERPPCQEYLTAGVCGRGQSCWFPHAFPRSGDMIGDLVLQISASHADRTREYILQSFGTESLLESEQQHPQHAQWQTRRHDSLLFLHTCSSQARRALIQRLGSDPIAPATLSRYYPVDAVFSDPLEARAYMNDRIQAIMRASIPAAIECADGVLPSVGVRIQAFPSFVAQDIAMLLGVELVKVSEPPPGEPDGDTGSRPSIMPDYREVILSAGIPHTGTLPPLPFSVTLKRHEFHIMIHAVVASYRIHLSVWGGNECISWGHMSMKRSLTAPIADARCRAFFKLVEIQQRSKVFPVGVGEATNVALDVGAAPGTQLNYAAAEADGSDTHPDRRRLEPVLSDGAKNSKDICNRPCGIAQRATAASRSASHENEGAYLCILATLRFKLHPECRGKMLSLNFWKRGLLVKQAYMCAMPTYLSIHAFRSVCLICT
jgi:23S rRNA U2552 (ribose-2'-O)-methylase RlmE/FtsJ